MLSLLVGGSLLNRICSIKVRANEVDHNTLGALFSFEKILEDLLACFFLCV